MDFYSNLFKAIPHNSKCRYDERGAADAKPKAQIILDAAKVSAASGGYSEPKQGQRSQSARGFCSRSTMRVPQPDIIEHFGNADAVPQLPEPCLSRKARIVRCCPRLFNAESGCDCRNRAIPHNSKCRYGERSAADAKPKAQIILDAAKVSAASGGNSEPKHDAGTATRHYRAFWQRRCRAAAAGTVLKP